MEITSGIHRIDRVIGANTYLVVNECRMLLIDTGMPGSAKKIIRYVKGLGKNPVDINYIILTHGDIDHIGNVAEMKQATGAKIAIHAADAPVLSGKNGFKTFQGPIGSIFKLLMRLMPFHPVEPDIIVTDGFEIDGFKIIHTPGHTAGSICLYLPPKVIFAGDTLSSDSKGNPRSLRKRNFLSVDVTQANASLVKISQLEFDICLAGHGPR